MKRIFFLIPVAITVLAIAVILSSGLLLPHHSTMWTWWIFRTKANYTGNYIGAINYYSDTNTYRAFGTLLIDNGTWVKDLSGSFFAMKSPNSESMARRMAIIDKNIPDSEMNRTEFYKYVIEEHPLTELFFCYVNEGELMTISSQLAKGIVDKRCNRIEVGT